MILSREVWRAALDCMNPFLAPVRDYQPDGQRSPCIAITGNQDAYMEFISCLAWVQYGTRPALALAEIKFLTERTVVAEGQIEAETVTWFLPTVHVFPEVT